jgi:hypothetical protein
MSGKRLEQCNDYLPGGPRAVELAKKDVLPRAEQQPSFFYGDYFRGPHESCFDMGIPIAVYPVMVPPTPRGDGAKTLDYVSPDVGIPVFLYHDCGCCSQCIQGAQLIPGAVAGNDLPNPLRYIHQLFT